MNMIRSQDQLKIFVSSQMGGQYVCCGRFTFKEKENRERGVGDKMD